MSDSIAALASRVPAQPPRWLAPAAFCVPLAYYLASADAYGGPFEEGTFIAAGRSLGVAHPPGAPITALVSAFAALLPVGPLSFRVAAGSAVCASLGLALFARALFFSLLGVGVRDPKRAAPLALAGSWLVAQMPLYVQQATRADVFAVQFALSMLMIEALTRFELSEPTDDRRVLYFAAFAQGLSFANHHVFALIMLAVAAPTLGRVFARRGFLGLMPHVAVPILGFSAWVYVPIRGGRAPFINIGEPSSLTRTLWVLGADPWWGPSELEAVSSLTRLAEGMGGVERVWSSTLFAAALLGLVLSSRSARQRRFALLWLIALLVPLISATWFFQPKLTADAYGALVPCAFGCVALALLGLGLLLERLWPANSAQRERLGGLATQALALSLLTLLVLRGGGGRRSSQLAPLDLLDDLSRRSLPPRTLVLASDPGTWFRWLGSEAEEQLRPDVTLVPLPFLDYPRAKETLVEAHPELMKLMQRRDPSGVLASSTVRELADLRPTLLELGRAFAPSLYPLLESAATYERVHPRPFFLRANGGDLHDDPQLSAFQARLVGEPLSPPLAHKLARLRAHKALVAGTLGQRARALLQIERALELAPNDPLSLRLYALLSAGRTFDPRPFLRAPEVP